MNIRRLATIIIGLVMVASVVGLLCGCAKQDPRASFETFTKAYLAKLQAVMDENEKTALALVETQIRENAPLGPVRTTPDEIASPERMSAATASTPGHIPDLRDEAKIPRERRSVSLHKFVAGSGRYDVLKSNSIVAPYEGILTLETTHEVIRTFDLAITVFGITRVTKAGERHDPGDGLAQTLKFGYRDGRWEPMTIGETTVFDRKNGAYMWTAYERTPQ